MKFLKLALIISVFFLSAFSIFIFSIFVFPTQKAHADISSNLVGYWNFDEGSGTTAADSAGSNTGSLGGGATWAAGKFSNALSLDGVDDYVNMGNSSTLNPTNAISISAWINTPTPQAYNMTIVDKEASGGPFQYVMRLDGSQIMFRINGTITALSAYGAVTSANTWYHVVGTYDGSSAKVYVNGVANGAPTSGSAAMANDGLNVSIGHRTGGGDLSFAGKIDDVRIYNRALLPADVSELYSYTGGTPPATDTTGPVISAVSSGSITSTGATITWTTDEVSDSRVEYGTTASYGSLSATDATLTTTHSVSLSSLSSNTTYHYRVRSRDASNNFTDSTPDQTFTTSAITQNPTTYTLTVTNAGAGSGTVSGTGISCPTGCSTTANSGSTITLTATPSSDSTFSGWSGGSAGANCSGTGTCSVTLAANTGVTATFALTATSSPQPGSATVAGSVSLLSTFNSISVKANFSGDNNANNSALIQYRPTGSTTWINAYTPFVDRRATLGGVANPYVNQARGSIVGLSANTSYEVKVTWTDADGAGTQPSVASISTQSYTPTTGGSTITVTNNATLASALSSVSPGQTIHLNPGTYAPFTISRSGNASAWIKIEGDAGGGTIITGGGATQNISVNANYVIVGQMTLGASDWNGIVLSSNINHVFIQDNTIQNISALCGADPNGHYGDGGVTIGNNDDTIFVLRNTISSTALGTSACTLSPVYNSPGTGIQWSNATTLVVEGNTITGGFRDAISSDSSINLGENIDIVNNIVSGYKDDGPESKGGNINVRIQGNSSTLNTAGYGNTCIAINTNTTTNVYGPIYIYRNTCRSLVAGAGGSTAYKISGTAMPQYLFHNSVDISQAGGTNWDGYGGPGALNTIIDNILLTRNGVIVYSATAGAVLDYNLGYQTLNTNDWAYLWNGATSYSSLSSFVNGTGQDSHSIRSNPSFIDTLLHIDTSSPAYNAGAVVQNFDSLDSAWPYMGSAPDIGAYEYGSTGGVINPPPPGDTTAPTVSITSPLDTATISGTLPLSASASDNVGGSGMAGVQFQVDGQNLGVEVVNPPYAGRWDTTGASNGTHVIKAIARDATGNIATSTAVTVTVNNVVVVSPTPDLTAPTVPTNLAAVAANSTQVNLSWTASTDPQGTNELVSGVAGYRIYRNNTLITTVTGTSYSDSGLTQLTTYSYKIAAIDAATPVNVSAQTSIVSASTPATPPPPVPPILSAGSPTSALAAGTVRATLSLTTDKAAVCKYSATANTTYAAMTGTFTTTGNTTHSTSVANLTDGSTYTYYIRCDSTGLTTTSDYIISFSVSNPPVVVTTTTTGSGGTTGGGSTGGTTSGIGSFTPLVQQPTTSPTGTSCTPTTIPSTLAPLPAGTTNLTIGTRSATVTTLQTFLVSKGYLTRDSITGYYGPLTNAAVVKYKAALLPRTVTCPTAGTGAIGASRLAKGFQFTATLIPFATNPQVKSMQIFLNDHGYTVAVSGSGSKGNETTYFGNATKAALIKFQKANNISPAIGNWGPLTRAKVNSILK